MEDKQLVFIIGMHKSGTSMLGSIFEELGFFVGDEDTKLKPALDNYTGFAERLDVNNLNDRILEELKLDLYPSQLDIDYFNTGGDNLAKKFKPEIEELIKTLFSQTDKVVVKDPRICLTLPLWLKASNSYKVKFAFIYRDPIEVSKSLLKRNSIKDVNEGVDSWITYNKAALSHLNNERNVIFFNYENFLYNTSLEGIRIKRVVEDIDLERIFYASYSVVEPSLRNNNNVDKEFNDFENHQEITKLLELLKQKHIDQKTNPDDLNEIKKYSKLIEPILKQKSEQVKIIINTLESENKKIKDDLGTNNKLLQEEIRKLEKTIKLSNQHIRNIEASNKTKDSTIDQLTLKIDSNTFLIKKFLLNIKRYILG